MDERITRLQIFAQEDLRNLLSWWDRHIFDTDTGYVYGRVDAENNPDKDANRFIVLSARLLWTYACAARVTGEKGYLKQAEMAYALLSECFYDKQYGGFYTSVDSSGASADDHKLVYGNAFAIYALAEYARATGCEKAAALAAETVDVLDAHIYDPIHKGYFETASRAWARTPTVRGMNRREDDEKTMNTHLHLIEAYTNLLRVRDTKALRSRVRELLYLFLNKIVSDVNHHFHYYQLRDWTPNSTEISFGHDIEGSWLLMEAAEVLGEPEAVRAARDICINMARAVYEEGIGEKGGLLTEYSPEKKAYHPGFSWWEQAEAVVGFLNAWEHTGEVKFLDASLKAVDFIGECFIDRRRGGWFSHVNSDGTPREGADKANGFICPYHNARMSFEIIERAERLHK